MCRSEVKRLFRVYIVILLVLSVIQVISFKEPMMDNASADSWVQSTFADFNAGTGENITITSSGNVTLALQTKYVDDDFIDGSKIGSLMNVILNTTKDEVKLDKFNKTFGGPGFESGRSVQQTSDGGYIIVGFEDDTPPGNGNVSLIKTDSSGNELWSKTFDLELTEDIGYSVQEISGGDFIICGSTFNETRMANEVLLIKTDSFGNMNWSRTFTREGFNDIGYSVQETSDFGFIICGSTFNGTWWNNDVLIIKTDIMGFEQWSNSLNRIDSDVGRSIQQTSDGGYIITGNSSSPAGDQDVWLIKTDSGGFPQWEYPFGGVSDDYGYSVQQTNDMGYIIAGYTNSFGAGNDDVYLIKTDSSGNQEWNKTYGDTGWDRGYSVQQTNDMGYIIAGYTDSFGAGNDDVYLIKTDFLGNQEWNNTFGANGNDLGYSVDQTSDDGFIIAGETDSFSTDSYADVWLLKTDQKGNIEYFSGNLTSTNLLAGQEAFSIDWFNCSASIFSGTNIQARFSNDWTFTWSNWYPLSDGFNAIDLSSQGWQGNNFFYQINFLSNVLNAPSVQYINLSYSQYLNSGSLESQQFNTGAITNWTTLDWNFVFVSNTDIKFQLRTASNQSNLSSENFVGPDGTPSTYYETSGTNIWSGHNPDSWVQYKTYLTTLNGSVTPLLMDVTIFYNISGPLAPDLVSPINGYITNDDTPTFNWNFIHSGSGFQVGFQVLIDNDINFLSPYDSGEISSSNEYWTAPQLNEGTWYWKVRTRDDVSLWGPYSSYRSFTIDTTDPNSFTITADYETWTSETQFDIYFYTTDANGIDHYEVRIDTGGFIYTSSPYTIPAQSDGTHTITVRAYDVAGNYYESSLDIYIDTTPPSITHTIISNGTAGVPINITADVVDVGSGLKSVWLYYKKPSDATYSSLLMVTGSEYHAEIPGSSVTSEGLGYYIMAEDQTEPSSNSMYYSSDGQTPTPPSGSNDIDIDIEDAVVPPTVIDKSPIGTLIPDDSNITITFSSLMDMDSVETAFLISPYEAGSFSWYDNTMIFDPDINLHYNTTYNVTIGTDATNIGGLPIESVISWEFITIPAFGIAPKVDHMEPYKETDVRVSIKEITIWFSEEMDEDTTEDAISVTPTFEYIPFWSDDYRMIILEPVDPLEHDTKYTITVSTNATDKDGHRLAEEYDGDFFTEKEPKEKPFWSWENLEPIITGLTILASILLALFGFMRLRKKRDRLKIYLDEIDDTYNESKNDYLKCRQELIALREKIRGEVKDGKVEENHFLILDKKIDDYLQEIKVPKEGGLEVVTAEVISEPISEENDFGGKVK